jgi:iron complex outermembrane receptor protein
VTGGQYYKGDGDTLAETARIALPIGENGYFDLTGFHRFHDFSQRGGADRRISLPDGTLLSTQAAYVSSIAGYPRLNHIVGDARSFLTEGFYNTGYTVGGVELYSFGSYSRREASAYENYRVPTRVARTVAGVTTLFNKNGFNPREALIEDDYSFTGGARGEVMGWSWDLSGTYGKDKNKIYTLDTANASLFADTGSTPTDIYDGTFISSEFTGLLELKKDFAVGLAEPLTVATGAEFKRNTYTIRQGDAASIYKEGGQSYPGFQPTDAGTHSRKAESVYIDFATKPIDAWSVDIAGRYEHYSDFGSKVIGRFNTRFDFSPAIAVRGTVSTGFRAPTLAEAYYSATNVSPTSAVVQLPPNSAAAAIAGFSALKPEKSTNLSGGFIAHPVSKLTVTLDAYQISIKNRIAATGTILDSTDPRVSLAIAAHGNILDPQVTFRGISLFTNGVNTRTRGVELSVSYPTDFDFGRIDWSLSGNYNKTTITRNKLGNTLFNEAAQSNLETASPRIKATLGTLFTSGPFSFNLRETLYGKTSQLTSPSGAAPFYKEKIGTAAITDLEVTYKPVKLLELSLGANNLFNKKPPTIPFVPGTGSATTSPTLITGGNVYYAPYTFSPYGINGGYYYGRITLNF